ncbi:MAG: polysaccharide biosynthesis protein [Bacteroidales bacterium]|nr:polysaccharide biosynthesis protein [Bacteroidales bacterium]MBR6846894.1 polysaccharide biosynthesis protein [Bacteroidales bacterium]
MSATDNRPWISRLFGGFFSKRVLPYWCVLLLDTAIVFLSCLFCFWVEKRSVVLISHRDSVAITSLFYALLSWVGARIFRTYSGVVRYSSMVDLMKVAFSNLVTLALALISYSLFKWQGILPGFTALSPIAIIASLVVATMLMWAMRLLVRTVFEQTQIQTKKTKVLIYGALTGGVGLAKSIRDQKPQHFELCGFISHEHRIRKMSLMGVPVFNPDDDLDAIVKKLHIEAVLVSPLRVDDFRNNQKIQDVLIGAGCKIYMAQLEKEANLIEGELSEEDDNKMQLKEVSVEDLLPRQQISVDMKSLEDQLKGKRVLITGSAGSIGAEIVRQVAAFHPAKMMLIDQAETPQHDIRLMMANEFPDVPCEVVVTSISRRTRMESVFSTFRPEYVFHAAAYKHVPMMEDNPSEAVMNNVYGTKVIADMSVQYGAKKFVMISTDKAVNPTNVMGCSKRICEIYVQSLDRKLKLEALEEQHRSGQKMDYTQFVTTRFGNVLGSNGSVIPLFREQIKKGGPVTVTDERIVRFFMLIPEACKLVLEAGTKGNGGEIFVFDMGEPVKIADLAKRMIALSHAKNVEIKYTGLREGEKLYEEVLNELEGTKPTFHEKIRIAQVREYDYDDVSQDIEELVDISKQFNNMATVRKMKEIVPEYKSNNSVYEAIDKEMSEK